MGNAGIKGTQAGTALKNAFLKLSAGGKPVQGMLKAIGVEIDDGTGNMRKFTDVLGDIGDATAEFGNIKVAKVLDTLFGKRAIAGASNLIDGIANVREFEKSLKDAGKTSRLTAEIMRTSIDAKLKSLGSAATEAGFKVLNAFSGDGKQGIDALTEAIRNVNMQPFIEGMKVAITMGKGLAVILDGLLFPFRIVGGLIARIAAVLADLNDMTGIITFVFGGINKIGNALIAVLKGDLIGAGRALVGSEGVQGEGSAQPAPNAAEARAAAQQSVNVSGNVNFNNAPAGTTAEADGDVDFNVNELGFNGA
jgi:hypothetical protein